MIERLPDKRILLFVLVNNLVNRGEYAIGNTKNRAPGCLVGLNDPSRLRAFSLRKKRRHGKDDQL